MEPRYTHDCEGCTFLGISGNADLYFCEQGGTLKTIIARFSDNSSDYISGLAFAKNSPELAEAKRLATQRGLLHDS